MTRQHYLTLITAALLIGAALRATGIDQMSDMVHYDEAYYAVDALSLIEQPRFIPFFPDNFGRESLWMYWLTPALLMFGANAFALRVTAFFTAMLALSAVGLLARVLFGRHSAVWTVAALGVLFWHVLFSHLAFRALLYPMIGALAFVFLWMAWRTNRLKHWILAGAAFGVLSYTYFAARGWIALALLMLLIGVMVDRRKWRGSLLAALIGGVISAPLAIYLLTNPTSGQRLDQVVISDVNALISNIGVWLKVWIGHGADDSMYNLPGRPIFDTPLAILAVVGIIALVVLLLFNRSRLTPQPPFRSKRRRDWAHTKFPLHWERGFRGEATLFIFALAVVSVVPAILTTEPLKWLRAIGLIVPLALVLGVGLDTVQRLIVRLGQRTRHASYLHSAFTGIRRLAVIVPAALVVWAGLNSAHDFQAWVTSDDLYTPMEQHLYQGIDEIAQRAEGMTTPAYFVPFTMDHPVLRFREWRLEDRPVGAFKSVDCLPLSEFGSLYFGLTAFEPDLEQKLERWFAVAITGWGSDPLRRYWIFPTTGYPPPFLPPIEVGIDFGGLFDVRMANEIPDTLRTGASVSLEVALRRVGEVSRAYTMFLHTYPLEETRLLTQIDRPLCPSYPPTLWRDDETVIHTYMLPLPTEAGEYRIVLGIYDSETLERLLLDDGSDVAIIGTITVGDD